MSLNLQPKSFLSKVSVKLATIYSMGLIISSILVFSLVYFQVLYSFGNQERRDLTLRLNEISQKIESSVEVAWSPTSEGITNFNFDPEYNYFVFSAQGDLLFSQVPDETYPLSDKTMSLILDNTVSSPTFFDERKVEELGEVMIASKTLRGGERIVLAHSGRSMSGELIVLKRVFWWTLFPVVVLGFFVGLYLSSRIFRPLNEIVNVFRRVEQGSFSARVPVNKNNDEMNELKQLSNGVLDQVELAISNLREAFDHLAHDIRTPVTRLRGRAELALNGEESVEAYREALQSCYENSDRILRFLETLTQISEAENRALKLKLERMSLGEMVNEIMELYEIAFEEKNIIVKKILLKADLVDCDQHLIKRVIANLLDNAHKYTPENGEIFIETYKTDKHVVLSIRDSGMGIPREEQSLIWNRLFRGDKSRTAYGMGLGLTFVRAVVEAHGGTVSVLSPVAEGRGTEFLIKLKQPKMG